jgi:tetratricopeptide (TPR) repeat protein
MLALRENQTGKTMTQQLITLAKSAILAEEYVKAIERLEEAITNDPENETAITLLAEAKQKRRGQLTEHVNSLVSKSQMALEQKDYDAAISLLESVLALAKDDPYVADLAREHTVEVKLEQAQREKELEHRLQIARNAFAVGDYDAARHALSRKFVDTRDNPEAEKLLRQIEDAWQLFDSARLAINSEQYTTASEILQELQQRFPQSGREVREMQRRADYFALIEQAERALQHDAIEEAEKYYREAIRNNPQDEKARTALQGMEDALSRKRQAADLVKRGQLAMDAGDWEVAVRAFDEALEYEQDNRQARRGLKEANFQWRSMEERETEIKSMLNISQQAIANQDFDVARHYLDDAFRLNPNHQQVNRLLAELEREEQREAKIQELLTKGRFAIEHQNFSEARQILRDAQRVNPQHRQVLQLLDELEESQKRYEAQAQILLQAERAIRGSKLTDAETLYKRILSLNPDNTSAIEGLEKVELLSQNARAEQAAAQASEYLRAGDAEQALRLLKQATQLANSADLKEQIATLTSQTNALIARKAEIQRRLDEATIHLSLNQPNKALEITNELLQANPADQAIRALHQQAYEAAARKQIKVETRRPSPTQYVLAVVFIIIFILSLLRLLGVW